MTTTSSPHSRSGSEVTVVLNGQLSLPLAPENISLIPLYHAHMNLWDTILGDHGTPGLAQFLDVSDEGKLYRFAIREGARFSHGRPIRSQDIKFSLERLMGKQPGGHFSAKAMIEKIEIVDDLQFNIRLKVPTASFLFLLGNPEMGIVPKEACAQDGSIQSLSITSGAYTVEGQPEINRLVLAKNPHFLRHDPKSPHRVTLLFPGTADGIIHAALEKQADLIEAYDDSGIEAFHKLEKSGELSRTISKPSASIFLVSNPSRLSLAHRLALTQLIHERLAQYAKLDPELEEASYQLLPPRTFGSLEAAPHAAVDAKSTTAENLPKRLRIAARRPTQQLPQAIAALLKSAHVEVELTAFEGDLSQADLVLRGQGMNSDYPEIEFYLAMVSEWAWIPASKSEKNKIMEIIHSQDSTRRRELIRDIGSAVLKDARVIPLVVRSYAHLHRKERIQFGDLDNYDGDLPFWRMRVMGE